MTAGRSGSRFAIAPGYIGLLPAEIATGRVVGTVYNITIKDEAGKQVSLFQENIEVFLPYSEEDLKNQSLSENNIVPNYFDESLKIWVKVENYAIDKEKNVVVCQMKHLTRFALVAPADIVPPATPTDLKVQLTGAQEATLTWSNPKVDFHHVKIYRSEKAGELGAVLNDLIAAESYKDSALVIGKTYYYALIAVDAAGNESAQTGALSVSVAEKIAVKEPVKAKEKFVSRLQRGSRGLTVKALQEFLQTLGFFSQDVTPTEYFGPITEKSVQKFQCEFEIVCSGTAGTTGYGIVGPKTRAALNVLI